MQATARAHRIGTNSEFVIRIGQTQDVSVYRLITAKTYESHMFERSTK